MLSACKSIIDSFNKKINLLIIDDESIVLDVITSIFSSPLFNIYTGSTVAQAFKQIDSAEKPWHCWILDINIGEREDGVDIVRRYPEYPFALMLSGLRSMTKASQALQSGAMKVFDKTPESLDLLHDEVCKTAALGFVLGGKRTQYLKNFTLLMENLFTTPAEWAESKYITVRQLERICSTHSMLSPKYCMSLYYALYYILSKDEDISLNPSNTSGETSDKNQDALFRPYIEFVSKNLDKIEPILFK